MTYPLFLDVEFEPTNREPMPTTPVAKVFLGFKASDGLKSSEYFEDGMWPKVSKYICAFHERFQDIQLVGWNLRNLVWPAIVGNLAREGLSLPRALVLPLNQRWNNLPMVDLTNVVMQGGYPPEGITLKDAEYMLLPPCLRQPLQIVYAIYERYAAMSA